MIMDEPTVCETEELQSHASTPVNMHVVFRLFGKVGTFPKMDDLGDIHVSMLRVENLRRGSPLFAEEFPS